MIAFGDSITEGYLASNIATLGYVGLLGTALGVGVLNRGRSGATMNGGPAGNQESILTRIQAIPTPAASNFVVGVFGTNDNLAWGTDAAKILEFKAGLTTGLLHLTGGRRIPDPQTPWEVQQVLQGRALPSVPDMARVFVGNCPKASVYIDSGSSAGQIAYSAAIAEVVAAVAAMGRPVYLVDVATAYVPGTMGGDPPNNIHPNDTGHAAIKAAFLSVIEAHP